MAEDTPPPCEYEAATRARDHVVPRRHLRFFRTIHYALMALRRIGRPTPMLAESLAEAMVEQLGTKELQLIGTAAALALVRRHKGKAP